MLTFKFLQVLTPADDIHHINKHNFKVPFVCGCRDLGEALRRIVEGAAMIRTKGEAGTGNVVEAVRHTRSLTGAIRQLQTLDDDELYVYAKEIRAPVDLVRKTKHLGRSVFCSQHCGHCSSSTEPLHDLQSMICELLIPGNIMNCLLIFLFCHDSTCCFLKVKKQLAVKFDEEST